MRFIQFRDYDCSTSFYLANASDEVINSICRLMELAGRYPYTLYLDFDVSRMNFNDASIEDLLNFYTEIRDELNYMDFDKPNEIRRCLDVINNYYSFESISRQ